VLLAARIAAGRFCVPVFAAERAMCGHTNLLLTHHATAAAAATTTIAAAKQSPRGLSALSRLPTQVCRAQRKGELCPQEARPGNGRSADRGR